MAGPTKTSGSSPSTAAPAAEAPATAPAAKPAEKPAQAGMAGATPKETLSKQLAGGATASVSSPSVPLPTLAEAVDSVEPQITQAMAETLSGPILFIDANADITVFYDRQTGQPIGMKYNSGTNLPEEMKADLQGRVLQISLPLCDVMSVRASGQSMPGVNSSTTSPIQVHYKTGFQSGN